jgi:hypothetical protein
MQKQPTTPEIFVMIFPTCANSKQAKRSSSSASSSNNLLLLVFLGFFFFSFWPYTLLLLCKMKSCSGNNPTIPESQDSREQYQAET